MSVTTAIVLAGGSGQRFSNDTPKQFVRLAGRYLIEHTIDRFEKSEFIDAIVLVVPPAHRKLMGELTSANAYHKIRAIVSGGATRRESSRIGIESAPEGTTKVLIHDGVRPFLSDAIIEACTTALDKHMAVDVAIPCADTIIRVDDDVIVDIPQRAELRRGQTPQAFDYELIRRAHRIAQETGEPAQVTDDCGLVFHHKLAPIHVVGGEPRNLKITYPEDIFLANKMFQMRSLPAPSDAHLGAAEYARNKVIVVFGHSSGIGAEVVRLATEYGATVEGFSRKNGCDIGVASDVDEAIANVVQRHGRIDCVIVTAGQLLCSSLVGVRPDEIESSFRTNYLGPINVLRSSFEALSESQGTALLFTSSSYTRGRSNYSLYSSMKAAIVNLAQAVADEWTTQNVRVNVICPARTDTPMRRKAFGAEPPESLISPRRVAEVTLAAAALSESGQVIEIQVSDHDAQ
tara:strand:+ start:9445 stop:10824 length:1380 start_codon:yes stop_codon:yes gene_type:complete